MSFVVLAWHEKIVYTLKGPPGSLYSIKFLLHSWGSLFGVPITVPVSLVGAESLRESWGALNLQAGFGTLVYSPPEVDRIWLWVYYNKIPIYPIFYLLKGTVGLMV